MEQHFAGYEQIEIQASRDLYEAAATDVVEEAGIRVDTVGGALALAAALTDVLALNRVVGLGLGQAATREDIAHIIEWYRNAGAARFFIQLCPGHQPSDLTEQLLEHGFVHHNNWVRLVRAVEPLPDLSERWDVREVDEVYSDLFGRLAAEAFGWPSYIARMAACVIGRPGWRHFMAFEGAEPVGTGAIFTQGETAWIGFAATRPEYRSQGVQKALIARRFHAAGEAGCTDIAVETAEPRADRPAPSYLNMLKFGFREAYLRPNYMLRLRVA